MSAFGRRRPRLAPGSIMTNDVDAARSVARLKRWVVDQALPLWGETGFDAARGAFVERLTFEGAPSSRAPRRAMVQARQIYVFSHAALLGWRPEGKAARARSGAPAHRPLSHGVDGAPRLGVFRPSRRRRPRREARFLRSFLRAVRARVGLQALAGAALSRDRARDVEGPRSALRLADRRLPHCFAGRRRQARTKPAHASLRGHAGVVRSHRARDVSCPGRQSSTA